MVRLILLTAPIGCVLGGIAAGRLFFWCVNQWWDVSASPPTNEGSSGKKTATVEPYSGGRSKDGRKRKVPRKGGGGNHSSSNKQNNFDGFSSLKQAVESAFTSKEGLLVRQSMAILIIVLGYIVGTSFTDYCWRLSKDLSNTSIILVGRLRDGTVVKLDDYREAYWWLRDNTPEDARIMAWWDYGYQIAGIANRTTIADGNTWNHEHIALLGMALTTDIEDGYEIARHLADYILVWGGGGGDDLAKSPHLARIANSVYRHHCPNDPTCQAFGFIDNKGTPSPMMERSLLFNLHGHNLRDGVVADENMFREVYRSKYGKVRIFKIVGVSEESKEWVANPVNKLCDVEGSWFCRGQYPPALSKFFARKKDFAQLEDFNRKDSDADYQKQYFEALKNPHKATRKALEKEIKKAKEDGKNDPKKKTVDEIYNTWEDTEDTTLMWRLISNNQVDELRTSIESEPTLAYVRSKDGRGPMWWAFEQRNEEMTTVLMKAGVPHTDRDASGLAPVDLLKDGSN